jgi:hypothetical protein
MPRTIGKPNLEVVLVESIVVFSPGRAPIRCRRQALADFARSTGVDDVGGSLDVGLRRLPNRLA